MIPLGLTSSERQLFEQSLVTPHSIRVTVELLTLEGDQLSDLSSRLIEGQVDIDWNAEVTRSCTLTLLDIGRTLSFDSDSPADDALYLDRMIRVIYSVNSPLLSDWVDVPIFTGPITQLDRSDVFINIECQGKEVLALNAFWKPITLNKGMRKVDGIRRLLWRRAGERDFSFPDFPARLPKPLSYGKIGRPWKRATQIANGMSKQLFYDGRGTCRLRRLPRNPVYHFNTGEGGNIVGQPHVTYSHENLKNIIWVKGGKPRGKKKRVTFWKAAPRRHPLSPENLGRHDEPRYLLETIEDDSIRSRKEARELANEILDQRLLQSIEVTFDALPIPHLDPGDLLRLETSEYATAFRLQRASIPLVVGAPMTVGYMRKFPPRRRRKRRR